MKLIIGLGNPEERYKNTRHNVGYNFIDTWQIFKNVKLPILELQQCNSMPVFYSKVKDEEVLFIKPSGGMNNSGYPTKETMDIFKLLPKDLIIIYDDVDIPLGSIKIKKTTTTAGSKHNGILSIYNHIGPGFTMIKLGIDKPQNIKMLDYVLSDFSEQELPLINEVLRKSIEAVEDIINNGVEFSCNKYNKSEI